MTICGGCSKPVFSLPLHWMSLAFPMGFHTIYKIITIYIYIYNISLLLGSNNYILLASGLKMSITACRHFLFRVQSIEFILKKELALNAGSCFLELYDPRNSWAARRHLSMGKLTNFHLEAFQYNVSLKKKKSNVLFSSVFLCTWSYLLKYLRFLEQECKNSVNILLFTFKMEFYSKVLLTERIF